MEKTYRSDYIMEFVSKAAGTIRSHQSHYLRAVLAARVLPWLPSELSSDLLTVSEDAVERLLAFRERLVGSTILSLTLLQLGANDRADLYKQRATTLLQDKLRAGSNEEVWSVAQVLACLSSTEIEAATASVFEEVVYSESASKPSVKLTRVAVLTELALWYAKRGDQSKAAELIAACVEPASGFEKLHQKADALSWIAISQAGSGLFADCLKTLAGIPDLYLDDAVATARKLVAFPSIAGDSAKLLALAEWADGVKKGHMRDEALLEVIRAIATRPDASILVTTLGWAHSRKVGDLMSTPPWRWPAVQIDLRCRGSAAYRQRSCPTART